MESKHSGNSVHLGHKVKADEVEEKEGRRLVREAEPKGAISRASEPKNDHSSNHLGSKGEARAHKAALLERELDAEVDDEFEALLRQPNVGKVAVSDDPQAKRIAAGFTINSMNMRDATSGRLLWESNSFGNGMFSEEMQGNSSYPVPFTDVL